jgi:hypothetical protein
MWSLYTPTNRHLTVSPPAFPAERGRVCRPDEEGETQQKKTPEEGKSPHESTDDSISTVQIDLSQKFLAMTMHQRVSHIS